MATRFVELIEAAKMLGLTSDQLVEMRSNGDIHGYRDGASWKFKLEEIERVAKERPRGTGRKGAEENAGTIPFDNDLTLAIPNAGVVEDENSILVSEQELGHSGEAGPGKVIGKSAQSADSDLNLSAGTGSDLVMPPVSADTDLTLTVGASVDSDVSLVPDIAAESDVSLVPDPGSDREVGPLGGSDVSVQSASTGGTGRLEAGSSDMSIGSDIEVTLDSELALSDDDEVVLGGSGIGSDVPLGTADSGINLGSPSDSGLSLEADSGINLQTPTDSGLSLEDEPLDLAGSHISSLELPEDEAAVEIAEERTQPAAVKKDEEFLLAPSQDMFGDESDSGSQVIALEESGAFGQDADAMPAGDGLLAESSLDQQLGAMGTGAMPMPRPMGYMSAGLPEAPYSVWNVTGLLIILLLLSISGVMLTDIVQNMWGWEEGRDVSTAISDGITSMFK